MTDRKKYPPVVSLHDNVSTYFDNFLKRYSREMKCGRGCTQCCVANLTVFPVEAQAIFEWFMSQPFDSRKRLTQNWIMAELKNGRCVFLSEDLCSIYAVRPTVCRTQGLPLKVARIESSEESAQLEFELSLCELNFRDTEKIPPVAEWLDLERLNTLLAVAQKCSDNSVLSPDINALVDDQTGRIELSRLRDLLLQKLELAAKNS